MGQPSIKPVLFNTDMVRAILQGRKTQTRRIIRPHYRDGEAGFYVVTDASTGDFCYIEYYDEEERGTDRRLCPPYLPGDVLWVRETWVNLPVSPGGHARLMRGRYYYRADVPDIRPDGWKGNWKPSIHMPKEAARIFLRVKDVRAERLKSISWSDAMDEGFSDWCDFVRVWNKTVVKGANHHLYNWEANPWVWVITFERCEKPEGWP